MPDVSTLNVLLHGTLIGTLTLLPDDRTLFAFTRDYIEDEGRATLSLSFKDVYGNLLTETKPRARVPTFFSNLLPEGELRRYLAERAGVRPSREFFLLWVLGSDLPGAIQIVPADGDSRPAGAEPSEGQEPPKPAETALRFSLAGVQLKFSAVKNAAGGLTIPANGVGGSWIVKLPSTAYAGVPENEFSMMELARRSGIDVPDTKLVSIAVICGLPKDTDSVGARAFTIKRFDRLEHTRVHIEDFAQIFGLFPEQKYQRASYEMIAKVLSAETGEEGVAEFVRRFTFNALIGNADMHLKNWSVIYPDKRVAAIAPAYDFVATAAYIPGEKLALNFGGTKEFSELTSERFDRFADKANLSRKFVRDAAAVTVERFRAAWQDRSSLPISADAEKVIATQLKIVPIAN